MSATNGFTHNRVDGRPATNDDMTMRSLLAGRLNAIGSSLFDPRRDIDTECGYPTSITNDMYRLAYDRESLAARIVDIYPEECFAMDPELCESLDNEIDTPWELAWQDLEWKHSIIQHLLRLDCMSGICEFGALLVGIGDGRDLSDPVKGTDKNGKMKTGSSGYELLYLRPFDATAIEIAEWERDDKSPRFGQPTLYHMNLSDMSTVQHGVPQKSVTIPVHWTRVLHAADHRESSPIFGTSRMKKTFNRILDVRKVAGGGGEMYWLAAAPGYAFELSPETLSMMGASGEDADVDQDKLKKEFEKFANRLQRYISVVGMQVKSLAPQIADPTNHINTYLKLISVCIGVPYRIFAGSEEARLASSQDMYTWNKRLGRRQQKYINPLLFKPLIDMFMEYGILPRVKQYTVLWPDLNTPSDADKANVAVKRTQALSQYFSTGVNRYIPLLEYLVNICAMPLKDARVLVASTSSMPLKPSDALPVQDKAAAPGGFNSSTGSTR